MSTSLRIAASQFPVSQDMRNNFKWIKKQIVSAAKNAVEVIHFPETALPGYLGFTEGDPSAFDWDTLEALTNAVCDLAQSHNIWVMLGSIRSQKKPIA